MPPLKSLHSLKRPIYSPSSYIPRFIPQRLYSSSNLISKLGPRKALIYSSNGNPREALQAAKDDSEVKLKEGEIVIKFLASPINPADLNVIEGVYPSKPTATSFSGKEKVFMGGNEGLARVVQTAPSPSSTSPSLSKDELKEGDWVVMRTPQLGTWSNWKIVKPSDVVKLPLKGPEEKDIIFGATVMVNWLTAVGLLKDIYELKRGEWVLQNGANSGVGQSLIQVARQMGIKTLNFVRPRDDFGSLSEHLKSLGVDHVFTYDELSDKEFKKKFEELTEGKGSKVGLNGIGGKAATGVAALLGQDGHLISYGGMSKEPLKIPVGLQIFRNLTCHGYWHSRRWAALSPFEQQVRLQSLCRWQKEGKLDDPLHTFLTLKGSNEEITQRVREGLEKLEAGKAGGKLLLKWED